MSAVNTDNQETTLSSPFSIVPLGLLTLTQPQTGQALTSSPTISWNPVANATGYYVFLFDQYPTAEVGPINLSSATLIAGNVYSVTVPQTLAPGAYYVVVAGVNDQVEGTDANGQPVTVNGAAAAFSQITRFNVP